MDRVLALRGAQRPGVDVARREPRRVQDARHAREQVRDQQRRHVGPELRVEDVSLAVELLQARAVAELANRDVEHAEPDKVDCNQGHGGKPDDNLCAFGPGVSWGFRRGCVQSGSGALTARPAAWPFWKGTTPDIVGKLKKVERAL